MPVSSSWTIRDPGRAVMSAAAVREMETFMHLRTEKNVFAWGQRLAQE